MKTTTGRVLREEEEQKIENCGRKERDERGVRQIASYVCDGGRARVSLNYSSRIETFEVIRQGVTKGGRVRYTKLLCAWDKRDVYTSRVIQVTVLGMTFS